MPDYHSLSDTELIELCLATDAAAWEALVRRYQRLISSVAFRFRLTPDDAADIFQSVCLIMLQQLSVLREQSRLSAWLITITVRECWKFRARQSGAASLDDPDSGAAHAATDDAHMRMEDQLLLSERQHMLRRTVATLPPPCRDLLEQLFYQDKPPSYNELSQMLGMPVASIGPTRGRCLAKLKEALKQHGFA